MTIERLMNPNANEKPLEPVGSEQARKRNAAYLGRVTWRFHSDYFQHQLERAYSLEDGRPCPLYRCKIQKTGKVCYAFNLDGIEAEVRNQLNEGAQ